MDLVGVAFALFTAGYILGVWTAALIFRQSQSAYEDGAAWRTAERAPAPLKARIGVSAFTPLRPVRRP